MESTENLIREYAARMAVRYRHCNLGSARDVLRQNNINRIVDELGWRADNGDPIALAWFEH